MFMPLRILFIIVVIFTNIFSKNINYPRNVIYPSMTVFNKGTR